MTSHPEPATWPKEWLEVADEYANDSNGEPLGRYLLEALRGVGALKPERAGETTQGVERLDQFIQFQNLVFNNLPEDTFAKSLLAAKIASALSAAFPALSAGPTITDLHAQAMVDKQAENEGLWFVAQYASEDYLQRELRKLHAAVEQDTKEALLRRETGAV